jgi:hypothetical protein
MGPRTTSVDIIHDITIRSSTTTTTTTVTCLRPLWCWNLTVLLALLLPAPWRSLLLASSLSEPQEARPSKA